MSIPRVDRFTLVTFGRLTLLTPRGDEEESLAKRRLKLALLTVLATAKRPVPRATLVEMFWGDEDEGRARHSLSDALSHLRRVLGRDAITTHDADVALDDDAPLQVDAVLFESAVEAGDLARAAQLYAGPFLDGVEVEASPTFEHWVTRERRRLEAGFFSVCARQCTASARARDWDTCGALAERWLAAAPLSVDAAIFRLNALKAPGTREAADRALAEFEQLRVRLAREFDLEPEQPVRQLAESIRNSLGALAPLAPATAAPVAFAPPAPNGQPAPASLSGSVPASTPTARGPRSLTRRLPWIAAGALAVVAVVVAVAARDRTVPRDRNARPRIAIAVEVPAGDTAMAWLADGLPEMITAQLTRSPDIDVVPAAQVRALLKRRGAALVTANERDLADIGKRLGATLVVSATVTRDAQALVMDLTTHDVASERLLHSDALSRPNAVALADEAAARVLAVANAARPGLRISELETSSVEAYEQYVRAMARFEEGRAVEGLHALDAAIALDSGFVSAVHVRLDVAIAGDEQEIVDRLRKVLRSNDTRATEFDRLRSAALNAQNGGELERGETLARQLVRRYPRDPRAYSVLVGILSSAGKFADAEQTWQRGLSLDSLSMQAGTGPCTPCGGYGELAGLQMNQGKWAEAERSMRRWIELQPNAPGPWRLLATLLSFTQRYDESIVAMRRAISLASDIGPWDQYGRLLIVARRYDEADSLIAAWSAGPSAELRSSALDLRVMLARERGQFRASNAAIDRMVAAEGPSAVTELVRGNNLGRLGDYAGAIVTYERASHPTSMPTVAFPLPSSLARGFCWHHALLADAIAPSGDTSRLRAIADTLERACARSFYGRDIILYHHVRGLVAMQQGRWAEAEQELRRSRYSVAEAWTRTNAALAEVLLHLGRPRDALATLRDAYATPLDAMGRYQPRSEVDYLMSVAFRAAKEADSAAVYEGYARRAWRDADPEVRRRLAQSGFQGL